MKEFPPDFVTRMTKQLGSEAEEFFDALTEVPPTSIRLNHKKGESLFQNTERVPWCEEGYYLDSRPAFHLDPLWHGGAYYVQEASSMILDAVLKQLMMDHAPRTWLDMCAAPGGKTGILAKHMGPQDILVANEVVSQRRTVLWENLYKGGYSNTFITGEQPSSFREPIADIMLIDAPCAGEGMMRKEPEAVRQWSPLLVRECALLQHRIVQDSIKALKPGGLFIYSTCSYSRQENIENVSAFIREFSLTSLPLSFPAEWNIAVVQHEDAIGYQLYPHRVKGEGLFISVLQRQTYESANQPRLKKHNSTFSPLPSWLEEHMVEPHLWRVRKESPAHSFIHFAVEEKAIDFLAKFPKAELLAEAGQLKGKDFIPAHFLTMANLYPPDQKKIVLDHPLSLDYLERNTNTLPLIKDFGWYLICYHNTCLGWAKYTPQGWKNHYPLHWRLRSRKM